MIVVGAAIFLLGTWVMEDEDADVLIDRLLERFCETDAEIEDWL
jgi:hypothetical protein